MAATDSGRLERKTATITAALTPSPDSRPSPITIDSGTPSSTIPSTIARPVPPAWRPWERLRSEPPIRSMSASPAKNARLPANSPAAA